MTRRSSQTPPELPEDELPARPPTRRRPAERPPAKRTPPKRGRPARQPARRALLSLEDLRNRALPFLIGAAAFLLALMIVDRYLIHVLPFTSGPRAAQPITDPNAPLAPFYAPKVLAWRDEIEDWADTYDVNPNVIAIVMQIESCGDPVAVSSAGALGLMQVMPFHFENGENMLNPDTNVRRGMTVFYECLTQFANWDLGMALACYNGGPRVTRIDSSQWAAETRSYYRWATGLWSDVVRGNETSRTLDEWLNAGGQRLCQ